LYAVSAPNTAFSGYLPAPEQYTPLPVYPSIIWVDFVSTNVSTVRPGDTFKVDIGVRNIMGGEDGPSLGQSPLYLIPGTTPVFYTKDVGFYTYSLGGKDITSEFHIQPDFNYPVSISAVYAQATTLSFSVTAANLKTNGTVYIDANPVYEVNYNPQLTNLPDVYYRAYFDDSNMLVPAARNWQQQDLPGYAVINLQGSGADINNSNGDINKSYVDSLELIGQDSDYNRKFQTATKLEIPGRTKLIVQLSPGSDFDKDRFVIYVNEQPYRPGSGTGAEYNYDENLGSIELIIGDPNIAGFSGTGTVLISGYAADSLLHGSIGLITLNYTIMNSSEFKVSNTLPYPSPYNPDNGDLSIGFDCTRAGVEYSVHIYDVSGREVFKETGLTTALGYNRYSWDGKFAAGGIVGRGAYVTRLHFKGYDKQDVVTKFGVK
jgi:hypothetical protein